MCSIGGVGGCKCLVALLRGKGTLRVGCAYGDAIDEKLGPFNVGLDGRENGSN